MVIICILNKPTNPFGPRYIFLTLNYVKAKLESRIKACTCGIPM